MSQYCFRKFILLLLIFNMGCIHHEKEVTKQESLDFVRNLLASVAERNPNVFNNIFDIETFKQRIEDASNGKLTDKDLYEIPSALKKRRLGDELLQSVGKEGMYALVKSYEKKGKRHVIFRLYGATGLNYHDIELTHAGEEVKAADMYIYITGENFSKSLADIFMQLGGYLNTERGNIDVIKSITEIKKLKAHEEYKKALSLFESLPDTLKKQKMFQLLHVQIAGNLGNDIYKNALDEYQSLYPGEPGMYILLMEIHFSHDEYEKALDDINKMDSLIDKEPFLDYYRGIIYKQLKNDTKTQECLERLYKNVPGFGDGIIELIGAYARLNEIQKANALVKVYKNNKKLNQETLSLMYLLYPKLEK